MKPWIIVVGVLIISVIAIWYFSNPWAAQKLAGNTVPVKFEVKLSKGTWADPNIETMTATKVSSCSWGSTWAVAMGSVDAEVHIEFSGYEVKTNQVLMADVSSSTVTACVDIPPGSYPVVFELNWKQGSGNWDNSDRVSRTLDVSTTKVVLR